MRKIIFQTCRFEIFTLCALHTQEQLYSRPAGMRSPSDAKKKELPIYAGKRQVHKEDKIYFGKQVQET
jgi:hypothetical protein